MDSAKSFIPSAELSNYLSVIDFLLHFCIATYTFQSTTHTILFFQYIQFFFHAFQAQLILYNISKLIF